ncbi:MAG: methyltransferase family protein [Gemmatimonadaceae bacterium]
MNQHKAETRLANPGVKFPPPLFFVAGLIAAWFLESRVSRFRLIGGDASTAPIETAGLVLIAAGVLLILWAMLTFVRAHTAILPMRPASRIVDHGPYRISRNPMYTGMSVAYLGAMLLLNWGWALVMFPTVLAALYRFVISREEAYLRSEFGEEYLAYCRRVRRWI